MMVGDDGAAVQTQLAGASVAQLSASYVPAAAKSAAQSVPPGVEAPLEHLPMWSVTSLS